MQARLRREVPSRSVTELIRILEWEGIAEPGFLRRSTLQDQLVARGYSSRQMRIYSHDVTSARRFRKPWRNYLWQSDIKYGIHINGHPTYMKHVSRHRLFAVLTGDCGTGKTTILRKLRDTLNPQRYRMLYVSESRLTPTNFYQILLEQLGVHTVRNRAVAKQQLHEQLAVLQAVHDVSVVCVVDESHLLSFAMLEEIRFLLNTQFDSVSPIALILAGQPELWRRRLALEKCSAIRQRIDIQSVLNHYDRAYTGKYIQCQLAYAGATSELFTERTVDQIYEYSSGIARMIDKVCTSVLIYGSQNRMRLIDDHAVAKVLEGEFS